MDSENKTCRNCASAEIYVHDARFAGDASAALPISFWASGECRLQVCGRCGLQNGFSRRRRWQKSKVWFIASLGSAVGRLVTWLGSVHLAMAVGALILSALVFVHLMKSVTRLSKDLSSQRV